MAMIVKMPKLSTTMEEGTIVSWFKNEGKTISQGEPLFEVTTDKATVEVESPATGVILKLYYQAEETVPCGRMIAFIGKEGETIPSSDGADERPIEETDKTPSQASKSLIEYQSVKAVGPSQQRITPRAKKLAQLNDFDYHTVLGTGPGGRVVEKDIRTALDPLAVSSKTQKTSCNSGAGSEISGQREGQIIPMAGIRKVIASRMKQSLNEMAQANHQVDIDMTSFLELRRQLNEFHQPDGVKVSVIDLLIRAVTRALQLCQIVNSTITEEGIILLDAICIGVAVATENGLIVPVIRNTQEKSLVEISVASKDLIQRARSGKLKHGEVTGGTFTITNLGMYAVDSFTAIINPPESAILGVGRIRDQVVAENKQAIIRPIATFSLSYDHRIIDGAPAAEFMTNLKKILEHPVAML
jgi:pyruvate dehydrogenase E2 component (dihydrolipoamide acetyltransferase)